MKDYPFQITSRGISRVVGSPQFGRQHKGYSPGGAMDQFSYQSGNLLLSNPPDAPAIEIISAPQFQFDRSCHIVLTGAHHRKTVLTFEGHTSTELVQGCVTFIKKGTVLTLADKAPIGFRTYLCFRETEIATDGLIGRSREAFQNLYDWIDPENRIRVLEGPEFDQLEEPESLFQSHWKITNDFSDMGFRLQSSTVFPKTRQTNMVSEAVADGTLQLTPKGPIVLMRQRQTIGGYPRILNVISADIDQLAQYAPGQILRFKKVSLNQALQIACTKENLLKDLRRSFL